MAAANPAKFNLRNPAVKRIMQVGWAAAVLVSEQRHFATGS
jgi:hypothetical protein